MWPLTNALPNSSRMAPRARALVDAPMLIVTAVNAGLLAALHALFASVVSEPYMDEPFHVRALSAPPRQDGWSRARPLTAAPALTSLGRAAVQGPFSTWHGMACV